MNLDRFKKQLRAKQTQAENRLWYYLRNRRWGDLKFRRQHIIYGYIVDFVCLDKKLIVEIDGGQHARNKIKDDARTAKLESEGYKVIRFWNNEVLGNIDGVLKVIDEFCTPHPVLRTDLSPKGRGERKSVPSFIHKSRARER